MLLLPNCKINIGLNVVARRADGYHNLETVFFPIPLRDNLEFKEITDEDVPFRLSLGGTPISGNAEDNLVIKVYLSLKQEFDLPPLDIFLYKHIPMGAGLGGGSSDAAAMMRGLNEAYNLGLSTMEMEKRIACFGADCAFSFKIVPLMPRELAMCFPPSIFPLKESISYWSSPTYSFQQKKRTLTSHHTPQSMH